MRRLVQGLALCFVEEPIEGWIDFLPKRFTRPLSAFIALQRRHHAERKANAGK